VLDIIISIGRILYDLYKISPLYMKILIWIIIIALIIWIIISALKYINDPTTTTPNIHNPNETI
jgi:hypothetical protein